MDKNAQRFRTGRHLTARDNSMICVRTHGRTAEKGALVVYLHIFRVDKFLNPPYNVFRCGYMPALGKEEIMKKKVAVAAIVLALVLCAVLGIAACEKEGYTVMFVSNGGTEVPTMTDVTVIETSPATTRDGYEFAGWYEDAALTQKAEFPYEVTRNMTMFAAWNQVGGGRPR